MKGTTRTKGGRIWKMGLTKTDLNTRMKEKLSRITRSTKKKKERFLWRIQLKMKVERRI